MTRIGSVGTWAVLALACVVVSCSSSSSPPPPPAGPPGNTPSADAGTPTDGGTAAAPVRCGDYNPLGNVYWGDLHVHTSYSMDAYSIGTRVDPKDAYGFARGVEVKIGEGVGGTSTTKLRRPLDFAAVTDHAENFSVTGECVLDPSGGRDYCSTYRDTGSAAANALLLGLVATTLTSPPTPLPQCDGADAETCATAARQAWDKTQQAAKAANAPCAFTSFVGYEWSSNPSAVNLHRNVIFSGDVVPPVPYDSRTHYMPMMLWQALESGCKAAEGCDAITVPHNSNLSKGTMWDTADDPSALPYMARYQVLAEVIQHKGASECLASQLIGDPSCDFETAERELPDAPGMIRSALARGLEMRAAGGVNPLALGMVASSDTHNGTPGNVDEDAWPGHGSSMDGTAEQRLGRPNDAPGGLAAVWAPENTREALFAAWKRREVYATSGPRIPVRFYALGGSVTDAQLSEYCADPAFPQKLVAAGAKPMGAVVNKPGALAFVVSAMKDEVSLDSIDIVKLAVGPLGQARSTVKTLPLASEHASAACVTWRDVDYEPRRPAVYYARVFQRPTWRWSHYDCAALGAAAPAECAQGGTLDVKIRERAWTSPVFVEP